MLKNVKLAYKNVKCHLATPVICRARNLCSNPCITCIITNSQKIQGKLLRAISKYFVVLSQRVDKQITKISARWCKATLRYRHLKVKKKKCYSIARKCMHNNISKIIFVITSKSFSIRK